MKKQRRSIYSIISHRRYCGKILLLLLAGFMSSYVHAQQWEVLGSESQVATGASAYTSIAVLDTVPYVVFREGTDVKVKKRNGATGAWEAVGANIGTNLVYSRIYVDKNNRLLVSYIDGNSGSNNNRLAVVIYNDTTSVWQPLGGNTSNLYISTGTVNSMSGVTQYASTPRSSMAFDSDNNPYIAYAEGSNGIPTVKKFDGTSWVALGSTGTVASGPSVAVSLVLDETDIPWLTFINVSTITSSTGTMALSKFQSGAWSSITPSVTAAIRHTSMALTSTNNLAIAYFNTASSNKATVIVYNKTANTWGAATALSTRDAPYLSLIRDYAGNLYCSFTDFINSSPVLNASRVFKQNAGATAWNELKDPANTRGIDTLTSNLTIATGSDTTKPVVVFTKTNSASVVTPVVRRYSLTSPYAVSTTKEINNITYTSATGGGTVTSDGGSSVTERGVVFGTSINPTIAGNKVAAAIGGTGSFTVSLSGFTPATFYYARAYAINGSGVSYGLNVNFFAPPAADAVVTTPKQVEYLNRGVVAVRSTTSKVYVGWRMLGTEPAGISFNVYRDGVLLNGTPISGSTNYEDNIATNGTYTVKPVINGTEGTASAPVSVWANNQLSVPLQIPASGTTPDNVAYTYNANDCSVGDVDGDGEYEIFVKWDPTNSKDNSQAGYTGNVFIDCYKMNGTRLWRIDLGRNIRAGAHYTQFMVYDFDGDGKAEMMCKTADATVDGAGTTIGDINADYRNTSGYILSGPEFFTVFNGITGAAMATQNYLPARGNIADWGDTYGNRVDRFIAAVAYLDGQRPSAVFGRGYYTRLVRAAWDWRNGQLTSRWVFDSNNPGNGSFAGMGDHQMSVGDVDGDGKDEVLNGSSMINDNGSGLWADGKGHGDALHMTDMDPERPGQEIWQCHEEPNNYSPYGLRLKDAKTGATQWGVTTTGDIGRCMAADIDPSHPGYEVWGSAGNLYDVKGNQISTTKPSYNFGIWWDGDLARELLDGTVMDKWNATTNTSGRLLTIYNAAPVSSNNGTKNNPCLSADLMGDWREEMIYRRSDNTALVIFTTTIATDKRIYTLMHDPQYRCAIAWQNSGYNQPPYPSFFIGYDMPTPPTPNIALAVDPTILPVKLLSFTAKAKEEAVSVEWTATNEKNSSHYEVQRSADGKNFSVIAVVNDKGNTNTINTYSALDNQPLNGLNYYRLKQVDNDGKFVYSEIKIVRFAREKQLFIYPNPATATVQLNLKGNTGNLTVKVANLEGKMLYQGSGSLSAINVAINRLLPTLRPGYYPVIVSGSDGVYKAQLIKQ